MNTASPSSINAAVHNFIVHSPSVSIVLCTSPESRFRIFSLFVRISLCFSSWELFFSFPEFDIELACVHAY